MKESKIESDFVDYAKQRGCRAVKLEVNGDKGWPDRMVLCPGGRTLFLELKNKSGRPSAHQLVKQAELRELDYYAEIVSSLDEAVDTLDLFLFRKGSLA